MLRSTISTLVAAVLVAAGSISTAPASAATFDVGVSPCSLDSELACEPAQDFAVTTDGALAAEVVTSASNCRAIVVRFSVDGAPVFTSEGVAPGASTGVVNLGPVTPGTHTLTVGADVAATLLCDFRAWSGTLTVTGSGIVADDVAFAGPGDVVTVSTAVSGSPRPAGIAGTLTRSGTAAGTAQFSVATYAGIPSVLAPSPPPIRAAAYLDLQLTNADAGDTIAGEFLPPSPIQPSGPPIVPPNPIVPGGPPILPPNPIRLAWWTGSDWSPVLIPGSPPILPAYDSVLQRFTFDFTALSSPSVLQLGGTVFAVIPNYYFRGFGTPVDAATLNVAKAGRAIPLKWQVFDETVAPVLDLDSAVVKISSVAISCGADGGSSDALEEYAAGASGLEHVGDGVYQLNWKSPKDYAGSCRRLRLDLGERNPDGTVFYRTADFQFTR
jgi:hypothetical protein